MDGECYKNCSLIDKVRHDDRDADEKILSAPQYAYQQFSPQLINYLDRLFAISPAVKDVYSKNKIRDDLIDIVPNCYDPDFIQRSDTNINLLSDDFEILYVGRLRAEKGVDLLVEAAENMDMSDKSINIVGEGSMREELEHDVTMAGLSESIRFHGWVDQSDLPAYYYKSDIFVHPGRWPEPFGRTILEALQCDCPPVVSDVGGPPWVVGSVGKIFEPGDAEDLAKAITNILSPQNLSQHKTKCGTTLRKFSPNKIISDMENRYNSVQNSLS
jgi:glycosyltransferase involved in cell wall biosynthesis